MLLGVNLFLFCYSLFLLPSWLAFLAALQIRTRSLYTDSLSSRCKRSKYWFFFLFFPLPSCSIFTFAIQQRGEHTRDLAGFYVDSCWKLSSLRFTARSRGPLSLMHFKHSRKGPEVSMDCTLDAYTGDGKICCGKPEAVQREKAFLRNLWPKIGFAFAGSHFSTLLNWHLDTHGWPSVRKIWVVGVLEGLALRMTSYGVCAMVGV